tara:strand:+ start:348 stop:704 length:357 start_codon:yes stop_codon:yes gene_type:complete
MHSIPIGKSNNISIVVTFKKGNKLEKPRLSFIKTFIVSKHKFNGVNSPNNLNASGSESREKKIPEKNTDKTEIKKLVTSPTLYTIINDADIKPKAINGIELKINVKITKTILTTVKFW